MALAERHHDDHPSSAKLSPAARRALIMLTDSPDGSAHNLLLAHGFKRKLISGLVEAKLATAKSELVQAGERTVCVTRIMITDAGRIALEHPLYSIDA